MDISGGNWRMPDLTLRRVPFTTEVDSILRMLKARTGVTPNILCRMGLCLSLNESGRPRPVEHNGPVAREINRYTLLGEYDVVFVALLRSRAEEDGIHKGTLDDEFLAHIHRGIQLLSGRLKSLQDLDTILPQR
jgi:DNA sulfur modification protein DndE